MLGNLLWWRPQFCQVANRRRILLAMTLPAHGPNDFTCGHNMLPAGAFKNTLLNAMEPEIILRLHLRRVPFELEHEIEFPGTVIDHLYFVEEGMASMTTTIMDGCQVEVVMLGSASVCVMSTT